MDINKLPKIITRPKKRVGRGMGSGKGSHTAGRGTKGQKARGKVPILYEGTKTKKSLVKRIPMLRGKGKFKAKTGQVILHLGDLADLPAKFEVTLESLIKKGLLKKGTKRVKILSGGEAKQALVIKVPASARVVKLKANG
ncbi:MAG: uL15 family ribosomal protein [Patescibacteria group bacterium]